MRASETLEKALALFGPNGEHWMKGMYSNNIEGRGICFCAVGAIQEAMFGAEPNEVERTIQDRAIQNALIMAGRGYGNVVAFNDSEATTFEQVKAFFGVAIAYAKLGEF